MFQNQYAIMKPIIYFITTFLFVFFSFSQELVEFTLGSGYQYDIYYSLEDGITGYPERTNWELSFSTNIYDGNIRINSGKGVVLYRVSDDISTWDNITNLPKIT